jgi:hypothetical protein
MVGALLWVWSAWVAFGLPVSLARKMHAAVREPRSRTWRTGRVMFYGGILVWCPYVAARCFFGRPVPLAPVLAVHAVLLYGGLLIQRLAGKQEAPPVVPAGQ